MNKWFVFPKVSKVNYTEDGDFGSLIFYDREENKMEIQHYGKKEKKMLMNVLAEAYNKMKKLEN